MAYPKGDRNSKYMSLYLQVADSELLPSGWRRHANFNLKIVNQRLGKLSASRNGYTDWFDQKTLAACFLTMILRSKLCNDEESDNESIEESEEESKKESEDEYEEASSPLKKDKLNGNGVNPSDLHSETRQVKETTNVHGYHVLPSQVELVKRIFDKHSDMALGFRAKNQILRTACMNVLLSLIETLCQSPQEFSEEDLVEANNALAYVVDAGFKVDWLEKKLKEVKEKNKDEQNGETRIQELEEELVDFKQKCSDTEALLEKEKTRVLAARVSLTLDDIV